MKAFVEAQVKTGQYASASDYIRALVREDQKRQVERELEAKLLAALDSSDFREGTLELFDRVRARVLSYRPRTNIREFAGCLRTARRRPDIDRGGGKRLDLSC